MARKDYWILNWTEVYDSCRYLARDIKEENFVPDIIIGISRGGLCVARILSDMLNVPDIDVIGVRLYKGIDDPEQNVTMYADISSIVTGKKILLVDDCCDSGYSMEFCYNYLQEHHKVEYLHLKTAAFHRKNLSIFEPTFHICSLSHLTWIVYPWEWYDFTRQFVKKKQESESMNIHIKHELLVLGIPFYIVEDVMG